MNNNTPQVRYIIPYGVCLSALEAEATEATEATWAAEAVETAVTERRRSLSVTSFLLLRLFIGLRSHVRLHGHLPWRHQRSRAAALARARVDTMDCNYRD